MPLAGALEAHGALDGREWAGSAASSGPGRGRSERSRERHPERRTQRGRPRRVEIATTLPAGHPTESPVPESHTERPPPASSSPSLTRRSAAGLNVIPQRIILQLAKLQIRRAPPKLARQARSPRARRRAAAGSAARRARGSRLGADGSGGVHRSATSQRRWCSLGSWPRCPAGPSARAGGLARRHVRAGCSWVVRPPGWSRSWSPRGRASGALPATGPRVDKTDVILQRAEY